MNGPETCRQVLQAQVDLACPQAVIDWEAEGMGGVLDDNQENLINIRGTEWPEFMVFRPIPSGGSLLFGDEELALSPEVGPCENRVYRLPLAALAVPDLNYIAGEMSYTLGNCGVTTYEVSIELSPPEDPGDENGGGAPIPLVAPGSGAVTPALSAEALQLLNQRQAANTLALRNLEEADPALANAAGFRLAKQFLLKQGDAARLSQEFTSAAESLLLGMTRAGAARKPNYGAAFTSLAHAYLDKILALAEPVGPEVETAWTTIAAKAADAGIDLVAVRKGWKAADLRKTMDKERVDTLDKLLK
jgi:hypothetical protein